MQEKHHGFIYITTNKINGKRYIGKSTKDVNVKYFGSGKLLLSAIEKYGEDSFSREILCFCDSDEELDTKEIYFIKKYNAVLSEEFYNLSKGGNGGYLGADAVNKMKESLIKTDKNKKENHWGFGKKRPIGTIEKISKKVSKNYEDDPNLLEIIRQKAVEQNRNYTSEEKDMINEKRSKSLIKFYSSDVGILERQKSSNNMKGDKNHMYGVPPAIKGGKWMIKDGKATIHIDHEQKLKEGWKYGRK